MLRCHSPPWGVETRKRSMQDSTVTRDLCGGDEARGWKGEEDGESVNRFVLVIEMRQLVHVIVNAASAALSTTLFV